MVGKALAPLGLVVVMMTLVACVDARTPIRIGVNAWPPAEIWYVAEQQGYFGRTPVEIVRFSVWSDNMEALYRGNLDVTHATYFNALYFANKGEKARIILSSDAILGADGLVVKTSLGGIPALRGSRIAVETNTDEHFLLKKALESAELKESDVTIISVPSEQAAKMFIEGRVQGAFTYEPFLSEAAAEGKGRVLWTTKNLPGYSVDVLVATQRAIDRRRRDLQNVLGAWFKAQEYIRSNPQQAFAFMGDKEKMDSSDFAAFYGSFTLYTARQNAAMFASSDFQASLSEIREFLLSHRAINEGVKVSDVFTAEIVKPLAQAQ